MAVIFTTKGWVGLEWHVSNSGGNDEFAFAGGDVQNAYDVGLVFKAWLAHTDRPWSGGGPTVWTMEVSHEQDRAELRFASAVTGFTAVDISTAHHHLFCPRINLSNVDPSAHIFASVWPAIVGMVMTEQWEADVGARCREGSWRPSHHLYAHRRPGVELALTRAQAVQFDVARRSAAQPRRAYIYDPARKVYRYFQVGKCDLKHPREDDVTHALATLEVLGGP